MEMSTLTPLPHWRWETEKDGRETLLDTRGQPRARILTKEGTSEWALLGTETDVAWSRQPLSRAAIHTVIWLSVREEVTYSDLEACFEELPHRRADLLRGFFGTPEATPSSSRAFRSGRHLRRNFERQAEGLQWREDRSEGEVIDLSCVSQVLGALKPTSARNTVLEFLDLS